MLSQKKKNFKVEINSTTTLLHHGVLGVVVISGWSKQLQAVVEDSLAALRLRTSKNTKCDIVENSIPPH
jgi:hypothetical protein